ncbi:MAG: hypothetical protein DCC67_19740 [Planctomycetota bacterium]|nr:MAG: hypothetical protein DCC67_19740 [Planctomycetota bacterium]
MVRKALVLAVLGCCAWVSRSAKSDDGIVVVDWAEPLCCAEPVVTAAWWAPVQPVLVSGPAVVRTRYRPLLGGVVTRQRVVTYGYAPAAYLAPVWW